MRNKEEKRNNQLLNLKMPFGKYKGVSFHHIPVNYCIWLLENTDIRGNIKEAALLKKKEANFAAKKGWEAYRENESEVYGEWFDLFCDIF